MDAIERAFQRGKWEMVRTLLAPLVLTPAQADELVRVVRSKVQATDETKALRAAERALFGRSWTRDEANSLRQLIDTGERS